MRTTVTLSDDVAAAVEQLQRHDGIGVSEAVNRLVREGLANPKKRRPYQHQSYDMGLKIDVACIGKALTILDEEEPKSAG